jgi:hypothetical protein
MKQYHAVASNFLLYSTLGFVLLDYSRTRLECHWSYSSVSHSLDDASVHSLESKDALCTSSHSEGARKSIINII